MSAWGAPKARWTPHGVKAYDVLAAGARRLAPARRPPPAHLAWAGQACWQALEAAKEASQAAREASQAAGEASQAAREASQAAREAPRLFERAQGRIPGFQAGLVASRPETGCRSSKKKAWKT